VPVGRPVKLVMTSRDVIHSFWVAEFRVKQDVVPGRMMLTWFEATRPGTYDILCAEYCGPYHSTMRGRVIALPPEDFDDWQRQQLESVPPDQRESLALQGERVAGERGCLRCHTVDGTPHLAPSWAGLYHSHIPLVDGRTVLVDDAYLTESMMDPLAKVRRGFTPIMPSYLGQLSASETAALVEYIRTLADRGVPERAAPLAPGTQLAVPLPTAGAPAPGGSP
jgi:cytochrome c oxidase subunit 2